jgi:hypothetical protein
MSLLVLGSKAIVAIVLERGSGREQRRRFAQGVHHRAAKGDDAMLGTAYQDWFDKKCGTRDEVWNGIAFECIDGARKHNLRRDETGSVVVKADYAMPYWAEGPSHSTEGQARTLEQQDLTQQRHNLERGLLAQLSPYQREATLSLKPWLICPSACGNYDDVWHGRAYQSEKGGLQVNELVENSAGKIVSLKRSTAAKRARMATE